MSAGQVDNQNRQLEDGSCLFERWLSLIVDSVPIRVWPHVSDESLKQGPVTAPAATGETETPSIRLVL